MSGDVIRAVFEAESILLLSHINPDGDAIGSVYGFKKALESLGKTVYAVTEEPLSDYFEMFKHEFDVLCDFNEEYDLVICPYENEDGYSMKDCLRRLSDDGAKPQKVAIIIGPEGGFADKEIDALKDFGAEIVTLGKTILRTETAGLVALTMVMYELEL